jgi:tetratricopeptide (TPR) repeat protein
MSWINPPGAIRRFTWHQVVQHGAAMVLWAALAVVAALSGIAGRGWLGLHATIGMAGAAFLLYHLFSLVALGARHDVSPEKVAFIPVGWEWKRLRAGPGPSDPTGKFAPEEKGDYLGILAWSVLVVVTGILLRWPGRLAIPGPGAYAWLRVAHAGCGAALSVHILLVHVPGRWLRSPAPLRTAVFSGSVPLEVAETRPGWIADLVASGALVPVPEAPPTESHRESLQVRDLLEEGNVLVQKGLYAEACAAFEEALRLFPDYSQARFNLAVARMRGGRSDLAAEQFRLFIQSDPFNPMASKAKELLDDIIGGKGGEIR